MPEVGELVMYYASKMSHSKLTTATVERQEKEVRDICNHEWRERVTQRMNWRSVCRLCGQTGRDKLWED